MRVKKNWFLITVVLVVLLIAILGKSKVYFTKVILAEDIPIAVYEDIKEIDARGELERGVWFYVKDKKNVSCIVFCGGKEFDNGYDVEIIDTKDSVVLGRAFRQETIQFGFNILESSKTLVEYDNQFSLPIVVYKAKKIHFRGGELVRHIINQNGDELNFKLRWVYND